MCLFLDASPDFCFNSPPFCPRRPFPCRPLSRDPAVLTWVLGGQRLLPVCSVLAVGGSVGIFRLGRVSARACKPVEIELVVVGVGVHGLAVGLAGVVVVLRSAVVAQVSDGRLGQGG